MKLTTANVSGCLVCLIGTATVIYGVAYGLTLGHMMAREAAATCDLLYLHGMLIQSYDKDKKWPAELDDVNEDRLLLTDPVSGKPYLYFPDARFGSGDVLVAQPECFRLGLWPFCQVRRHVVFARKIEFHLILDGQDAVALRTKGLRKTSLEILEERQQRGERGDRAGGKLKGTVA